MENIAFTPMQAQHLASLASIAAAAPDPWSQADFAAELDHPFFRGWAVSVGEGVAGFARLRLEGEGAQLGTMAGAPALRPRGRAPALV